MAFLKQCLRRPPTTPTVHEDDDIYPVHTLDDTKATRRLLLVSTIYFNDALDANKLRCSLARLLEIGDWRKIGGRLSLKEDGRLQIRVPRKFTAARPAFAYSHEYCAMNLEDHEMARRLPKADGAISLWPDPHEFNDMTTRSDAPTSLKDLLTGDTPQISLHLTSFFNATLVNILWPHTLMDVIGKRAFLHAWSLVLAGRESEIPRVLDAREDVLQAITDTPAEKQAEYVLKSKQLTGLSLIKFAARLVCDIVRGPKPKTRTICLPRKVMARLRLETEMTLPSFLLGEKLPFISDGDILTAWTLRTVATSLPQPQRMTALHAINARFRLPTLIDSNDICLQNMLIPGYTYLSSTEATGPLGPIALRNRQYLMEQATEAQVLANLREQYKSRDFSQRLYIDHPDTVMVPYTNWTKARIYQAANFRPAIQCAGEDEQTRCNPPGTPIYHQVAPVKPRRTMRFLMVVLGQDHGGNYWLTLTLSPMAWEKMMESLEGLGGMR